MEIGIILVILLQSMGVALGMGSSTLAITNFFIAIADGKIDETERNMMGVSYFVLRVAMLIVVFTSGCLTYRIYLDNASEIASFIVALWTLIFVLFANAILMTKHIMPSTVGPALQASTWYTLGVTFTLFSIGISSYTLIEFYLAYLAVILLAVSLVNGMMAYLKQKRL